MSKLIKRKDGSYSKRGLWDNIRKNKGSGKEPTKEMLKQESKIKKEENMKSMYKAGGKTSKKKVMKEARKEGESFMEESKEIGFGAPGVKPPKRRFDLGGLMDKDKPKEQPTAPKPSDLGNSKGLPLPIPPSIPDAVSSRQSVVGPKSVMQNAGKGMSVGTIVTKKRGGMVETGMDVVARGNKAEGKATMAGKKTKYKTGGVKKYEDGGRKKYPADDSDSRNRSRGTDELLTGTPKRRVDITYETQKDEDGMPIGFSNRTKTVTKFKRGAKGMESEVVKSKTRRVSDSNSASGDGYMGTATTHKTGGAMSKFKTMAAAGKKKMMGGKKC